MKTQKIDSDKSGNPPAELVVGNSRFVFDGSSLDLKIQQGDDSEVKVSFDLKAIEEIKSFLETLHLLDVNRREAYRVPLQNNSLLSASIRYEGNSIAVIPKTISVTGVFVAPACGTSLDLKEGDSVEITLDFEGESQKLDALVRRCQPDGFGLFFKDSMIGEQIEPHPQLSRLVMELQRRIMTRRVRNL